MKESLKEKLNRLKTERMLLEVQRIEVNKDSDYKIIELDLQIAYISKEIGRIEEATSA